jgi:hypothetical protein
VVAEVIEQKILPHRLVWPVPGMEGEKRVCDCPNPVGVKIAIIVQFDASPVGHMRSVWTLMVVQSLCF